MNNSLLRKKIKENGMTVTAVANMAQITRESLYNKMNGNTDFTAREIVALTKVLRLTKTERDEIFLKAKLN